ncbi:MAG: glutathione peroxidase [Oligoflexus sp.]
MPSKILDIPLRQIDGKETSLASYEGKVLLIANVASKCGLTPQYEGLESLYRRYQDQGFAVLGFPANEFLGQEPGSNSEIQEFCKLKYDVSFPMFEKLVVKGKDQHPLYQELTKTQPHATKKPGGQLEQKLTEKGLGQEKPEDILWNFEKFLVNRKGEVVGRFAPDITPEDDILIQAVETQLKA